MAWAVHAGAPVMKCGPACDTCLAPLAGLDGDHNGTLDREELRKVCLAVGLTTEEQLDHAIAELEAGGDEDGSVSFSEYLRWCARPCSKIRGQETESVRWSCAPVSWFQRSTTVLKYKGAGRRERPFARPAARSHTEATHIRLREEGAETALHAMSTQTLKCPSRRWRRTGEDLQYRMAPLKQELSSQTAMGRMLQVPVRGLRHHGHL